MAGPRSSSLVAQATSAHTPRGCSRQGCSSRVRVSQDAGRAGGQGQGDPRRSPRWRRVRAARRQHRRPERRAWRRRGRDLVHRHRAGRRQHAGRQRPGQRQDRCGFQAGRGAKVRLPRPRVGARQLAHQVCLWRLRQGQGRGRGGGRQRLPIRPRAQAWHHRGRAAGRGAAAWAAGHGAGGGRGCGTSGGGGRAGQRCRDGGWEHGDRGCRGQVGGRA
mmetsp:Transcript_15585/g.44758  ORF Transcript_15585/g.44758 Transcript_15585/m.44758 type:complete len:218 (-) Transcript_15585:150-803(-)